MLQQCALKKIRKCQQPTQGTGNDDEMQKVGAYISKNWLAN
jgi:hypothetical protein